MQIGEIILSSLKNATLKLKRQTVLLKQFTEGDSFPQTLDEINAFVESASKKIMDEITKTKQPCKHHY